MGKVMKLLKQTFKEYNEDKVPRLAAALAYYTVFSIPPLLVIVIAIVGFFFGRSNAQDAILQQVSNLIGAQGADAIGTILMSTDDPEGGLIATIIGVVLLLLGASGVFGQLQDSLNTIWEVRPKPGQGIGAMIRKRFFTFSMVLGVGFLLLVSMVITTFLVSLGTIIRGVLPGSTLVLQIVNFLVAFLLITLLFGLIYRYVPDAKIAWKDVWLGAAVTTLLFTIGKQVIGLYLGNSDIGSTFGIFASLIVLLVWVYYFAQIMLFGAEFTQVYANMYGAHIVPEKNAELVTEDVRANEGIPHQETLR